MQISPPITHESPSSSNTNAPLFLDGLAGKGSGGQTSDNDGFVRSNNTKSTLHADLPAAARLDTTDEHGAELSFAQLLLDDTTTEPTVDFQQQQETLIVEDQLPTDLQSELPSHFSNVLPLSNREVSDEIGKASQPNLPQAPVGPSGAPLLPITQQVNTTAALNEAEISETSQTNLPQAPVGPPGVPLPPITQQANTTAALNETEISETSPPNLSQALVDPAGVPLPPITQQADTTAALNETEIGEALVDPAGVPLPPITQQADTTAALNETEIGEASQPNLPQAPVDPAGVPLPPITQQANITEALNETEIGEASQPNLSQALVDPSGVPLPPITQQANTTAALNETETGEASQPNLSQALVDPTGVPLPPITQQANITAALNETEFGEASQTSLPQALVDPSGVPLPPITQQANTTVALNETEIGEASQPNLPQALVDPSGVPLPPITQQANTAVALTETEGTLTESTQSQLTPQEAETNSAANLSDTVLFDRPSFVTASTPQLEPPTLPAVPASHQAVTENVVDTIVEQAQLTEVGESKQLTLQLHPAELGQVTLLVDWEVDSLKVKIVANELAANEILNQNKSELIAALAEEGIDFDSLDVSYGNAQSEPQDHNKNSRPQQLAPELFASPAEPETETTETTNPNRSSNLDITI